jgi:hypothetical protein
MRTTKEQMREEAPDLDAMRYDLAEREAMNMGVSDIIDLLLNGFEGLELYSDAEIIEEWQELFGKKD